MYALILTNLGVNSVTPTATLEKWKNIMRGFDVKLIDAGGSLLSSHRERAMNRAHIHTHLWERISNLEYADDWVYVIEEDAKQMTTDTGGDLDQVQLPQGAGFLLLGSTQDYTGLTDMTCQSRVEPLSLRSSALLEAPVLAYSITPEFAGRLYGANFAEPVAISHVLVDMYEKLSSSRPQKEVPRFYRLSCAAFNVKGNVNKQITTTVGTAPNLVQFRTDIPQKHIPLNVIKERFEEEDNTREPTPNGLEESTPALRPIRMQVANPGMRPAEAEFAPFNDETPPSRNRGYDLQKFACITIVLCCFLLLIGYLLVRYFRRSVDVKVNYTSGLTGTPALSPNSSAAEPPTSSEIVPVF